MRPTVILLGVSLIISCTGYAQSPENITPYFMAIIVGDIDKSAQWYYDVLGVSELNRTENKERGFKQMNMSGEGILLELIEIKGSIAIDDLLADQSGSRAQGLFKFGFMLQRFDQRISELSSRLPDTEFQVVKDPVSGKKTVVIHDPDGNRIQFFEQ